AEGWAEPENLGSTINTPGNEMFPTMYGDTLYFSSNGHPGIGGLDLNRSWEKDDEWTVPENMNYPLNSSTDDLGLIFEKDGRSGFLSSDRSGSDRIYSFTVNEPTLMVHGVCVDDLTGEPMSDVEVKMLDPITGEALQAMTEDDGIFDFTLKKEQTVTIRGLKEKMLVESVELSTIGQKISKTYDVELRMKPLEIDRIFVVNNIYYDYDKWDIRPEAAVELTKLARLFMDNPNVSFELGSHTDCRASDMYNLVLSEARAKSAVDFLIRQGVDPQRITAKGHGESQLVNTCRNGVECSEEQHQQNRRTEFKVVRAEVVMN
nr:OmpA family protein [Bacteroidota bacterium]